MVALKVSPSAILLGGAAKPVVANLVQNILQGDQIQRGLTIDFSPYLAYWAPKSLDDYRKNLNPVLGNSTVSFATVQDNASSDDLLFGIGLRTTLHDDHDL